MKKIVLVVIALIGYQTAYGQFAKRNFTPQLPLTELSPQQAAQIRAAFSNQTLEGREATNPELPKKMLLSQEYAQLNDSIDEFKKREIALKGTDQSDKSKVGTLGVFGEEFFTANPLAFAPNENFATPTKYVLGPGDLIDVVVYGYQELERSLKVDPEGFVNIPLGGMIQVSSLSIEEAERRIIARLAVNGYNTLRTGESKLRVTLGQIRSINVYIVGAKSPGKYLIPSVSGIMHAIYVAGGPMENGSYRSIEIVRDNKVVRTVDLYDFMIFGRTVDDFTLRNDDVIRIPFFKKRVMVSGEFKRPSIYELKDSETFADAIHFAGGLNDAAFSDQLLVSRYVPNEGVKYFNLEQNNLTAIPNAGDHIQSSQAQGPDRNFITLLGPLYNPGRQGWEPSTTLAEALSKAGGAQPQLYSERGLIVRSSFSGVRSYLQFDPKGDLSQIQLSERDTVLFFDDNVFSRPETVSILGEVEIQGAYRFGEGLKVKDLIVMSNGFNKYAYKGFVEVNRRIRSRTNPIVVERIELDSALNLGAKGDLLLKPGDVVIVRPNPDIQTTRAVTLKGEWTFPGVYTLESRADRLSIVMSRAGGLTRQADLHGIYIIRNDFSRPKIQKDVTLNRKVDSIPDLNIVVNSTDTIALNAFSRRLKDWNYSLQDGDTIVALERKSDVRVTGAVQNPTIIMHNRSKRVNYYVNSAGGPTNYGKIRKSYVKYPNGMGRKSKNYLLFTVYPKVPAGSTVVVPIELELPTKEKKTDPAEVAIYTSVLGFLSSTIIGVASLFL